MRASAFPENGIVTATQRPEGVRSTRVAGGGILTIPSAEKRYRGRFESLRWLQIDPKPAGEVGFGGGAGGDGLDDLH